ncbi:MAG: cellulase family glycosylhydrolase [Pseudobacter sp.]|uniref:cellulase family glycosylhydrolase n=1 Tax=Pseudobacter sp. TaxID=2045420 RepID=UPI003F7DA415
MRIIRKYCLAFFLVLMFLNSYAQPVKLGGRLQVIGTQLSDAQGKPFVLNGMSFGWSCFHPRFYTKEAVKWLKEDWKVNVVRAAMGVEHPDGYLKNPEGNIKRVETVVDAAIREGLYVIIDWHSHNIFTKEAIAFFDRMSRKYARYPNVIYEIFNEPMHQPWAELKDYSMQLISTIRKNDPDNIILVGNPEWDQRIDLVQQDPLQGVSNIMYTVHFYAGTHKQWLRDRTDAAIKSGIPVFISESAGMEASGDGKIDYTEWNRYMEWLVKNKLSWISWSVSDKEEACSVLLPGASSTGNWKLSELRESGIKTREYLRQFNQRGELVTKFNWQGRTERTFFNAGKLSGPGSFVAFSFTGNEVTVKLKNEPCQGNYNYISVELDNKYLGRFKVDNNEFKAFTFKVTDKTKKTHDIRIVKATEAGMGEVLFDGSGIDALPLEKTLKKRIEFIGNSITCGFGNDVTGVLCDKGTWYDQHNAYLAYGPVVCRQLKADYLLSSVSGYGIYRNWNAVKPEENTLPEVYDQLYLRMEQPAPFPDDYQPDLVSICLGTNDLSDGDGQKARKPFDRAEFLNTYIEFIRHIYKKYPQTRIALLNSPMLDREKNEIFVECLNSIRDHFSNDQTHQPIEIFLFPEMKPTGCDYHPSAAEHQTMADLLLPFYQRLLK